MVFFKRLRTKAHHFILSRKLKKLHRKHQTCNFNQASSIAVLFDGTKPENMEPVKKYHQHLRDMQKKVRMLCFIEKERPGESISFDYITNKNLNWCFIPDDSRSEEFINQRFDLLINLCAEECLPLEYISALSNAAYRTGRYISEKEYCHDLMIDLKGNTDVNYLIRQTEHYLKMMK